MSTDSASLLDLHRLRLLHEFAQRGTLAAVAEALSYSPSTVSQQLAVLEREAGTPLLAPVGRRLQLTAQGRTLAAAAAELLDIEERARGELEASRPDLAPVRIAVFQSAAHAILPAALTLLRRAHPELRVEIAEVAPETGLYEVAARGYDLAVAEQYPGHIREHRAGLEREAIGLDPIRVALPPATDATSLADLAAHPWVLEPHGTASRDWAVQQCRAAGFEPDVRFETTDLIAHLSLIAAGHAVGLLPDLLWAGNPRTLPAIELPGSPHREIFTAVRSAARARPSITAVRGALRDSFAALVGRRMA